MKFSERLRDVGRPVLVYPKLARLFGSLNAAIFLSQLYYWDDKRKHSYTYKTSAEIEQETGLSYAQQCTARRILRRFRVLREKYARLQHEMHYWIDHDMLEAVWEGYLAGEQPMDTQDRSEAGPSMPRRRDSSSPELHITRSLPKRRATGDAGTASSIPEMTTREAIA